MENPETTAQWDRENNTKTLRWVSLSNNAVLKCHYQVNSIASLLSVLDTQIQGKYCRLREGSEDHNNNILDVETLIWKQTEDQIADFRDEIKM